MLVVRLLCQKMINKCPNILRFLDLNLPISVITDFWWPKVPYPGYDILSNRKLTRHRFSWHLLIMDGRTIGPDWSGPWSGFYWNFCWYFSFMSFNWLLILVFSHQTDQWLMIRVQSPIFNMIWVSHFKTTCYLTIFLHTDHASLFMWVIFPEIFPQFHPEIRVRTGNNRIFSK